MPRRTHPVKAALALRGETQHDLAAEVGCTDGTLNHVLNGRQEPWPALRERIADHFGVPESELFPDHGNDDLAAAARELAARTRRAQRLPDTVQDVAVLERIGRTLSRAQMNLDGAA